MPIKRMDHVSVVVDDLPAAIDFFTTLGLELEGQAAVGAPWVDRLCGLKDVQADIAMLRTPDGTGGVELTKYRSPKLSQTILTRCAGVSAAILRLLPLSILEGPDRLVARRDSM